MSNLINNNMIEGYILDIVSRSRSIKKKCELFLTKDYISDSPLHLTRTIIKICDYLNKATLSHFNEITNELTDWDIQQNFIKYLRNTDVLIQDIGSLLRFIDGSRIEKLPWSIIPAFQDLLESVIPKVEILIRPQWKYNYSIYTTDFRTAFINFLEEYKDYVPDVSLESEILSELELPFYLISFPSLERKNILLHPLLGHEIGHLLADQFITEERKDAFSQNIINTITKIVENDLKEQSIKKDNLFYRAFKEESIRQKLEEGLKCWKRGLEEILSDLVGTILFGPAALFASFDMALQQGFDHPPSPYDNFYPPWRLRLRYIIDFLNKTNEKLFPIDKKYFKYSDRINNVYYAIKEITEKTTDIDIINKNTMLQSIYSNMQSDITEGIEFFLTDCNLNKFMKISSNTYTKLPELIERLENKIPPNAYEKKILQRKPASLVEIINASWFFKICCLNEVFNADGTFNEENYAQRIRLNNLTLKAIEYSNLEYEYQKYIKQN